jgi:hypothetical protein
VFNSLQEFANTKRQLVELWNSGIPTFTPSEAQWSTWLSLHDEAVLLRAILKTTAKYTQLHGEMDAIYLLKYCSSVANSSRTLCIGTA